MKRQVDIFECDPVEEDYMLFGSVGLEQYKILKNDLGYLGVIDHGEGAIYTNEPEQAVIFDTRALVAVDAFDRRGHKNIKQRVKP